MSETCTWTFDDFDCYYTSECDEGFYFTEGPRESNFKYCPYCGRIIVEVTRGVDGEE